MDAARVSRVEQAAVMRVGRPRVGEVRVASVAWKVLVPPDLHERAVEAAARSGITLSELVRAAVEAHLAAPQ